MIFRRELTSRELRFVAVMSTVYFVLILTAFGIPVPDPILALIGPLVLGYAVQSQVGQVKREAPRAPHPVGDAPPPRP